MRQSTFLGLVLAFSFLSFCTQAAQPPQDDPQAAQSPQDDPQVRLTQVFGPKATLASERSPNVFRGDFNGDGLPDLLAWVNPGQLPARITVIQPWPLAANEDGGQGAKAALAVIHGNGDGKARGFLIHDAHAVSILDTGAALELNIQAFAKRTDLQEPELEEAKGDVIVLPTEAGIDTYLYWDGTTYQAFAPLELP